MGSYSRTAYMAIKAETTENTAVKPDIFIPLMSEDIVTEWGAVAATPVSASRAVNRRAIKTAIPAPTGSINLLAEPKTLGYFLKAVFGGITTGRYMTIGTVVGTFQVGETITGGTSATTATIVAISSENDYLLLSVSVGAGFADAETVTGGTSAATAVVGAWDTTVYGHQFTAPQTTLPTYTVEFGFDNEAYRYTGVRFNALNSIAQSDNIVTASIGFVARSEFKHARITVAATAGAGAKTITVDQTTGLAATDTIKVFRPSTGAFIDFASAGVKTHTVNAVVTETTFTVTALNQNLSVGDIIVLSPQTPSYTIDKEFSWIGGSTVRVADTIDASIAASAESIEDFELVLINDIESKYSASGANVVNRFPAKHFLKGLTGTGSLTKTYLDQTFLDRLRNSTLTALRVTHTGEQIGTTGMYNTVEWRVPSLVFGAFNPSINEDDLLSQEMPFDMYYSTSDGFLAKALLVNAITSY